MRHGNGFVTRFFKDEIDFKDGIGKLHNLTKASRILTLTQKSFEGVLPIKKGPNLPSILLI